MFYFNRYIIEKKEKLGTRWVKAGKTSGPDCNFRVTDVIEGTEVQFQVRAENEAGVGHPSEPTEILAIEDPTSKLHQLCKGYCLELDDEITDVNVSLFFQVLLHLPLTCM